MSGRARCDCGREHERWTVELATGGRVEMVGCAICTSRTQWADALLRMAEILGRTPTESEPTP